MITQLVTIGAPSVSLFLSSGCFTQPPSAGWIWLIRFRLQILDEVISYSFIYSSDRNCRLTALPVFQRDTALDTGAQNVLLPLQSVESAPVDRLAAPVTGIALRRTFSQL